MKIGYLGLGKLGLPCALATEEYGGHEIFGHDISNAVLSIVENRELPYMEAGAQELLIKSNIKIGSLDYVVSQSEILFVSIQTPHKYEYEGVTPIPHTREDFDYSFLKKGVADIADSCSRLNKNIIVVVISTVLPGTIEREVYPLLNNHIKLCYNPYFIAMGTTIPDYLNPEFVLLGCEDDVTARKVTEFYGTIHSAPVFRTSVSSAELIKVAYNTYIGMKIVFANTMMEICEKTNADVDELFGALSIAKSRIISPKYLRGGMGDGGGCHPRDNIAMSWLARKLNLSYDFFESLMYARENQTLWLAEGVKIVQDMTNLPVVILGRAYKSHVNLTVGSPALLLENYLKDLEVKISDIYDPWIDTETAPSVVLQDPAIFFVATQHDNFMSYQFPEGSVVVDPWGYIQDPEDDTYIVIRIGRK